MLIFSFSPLEIAKKNSKKCFIKIHTQHFEVLNYDSITATNAKFSQGPCTLGWVIFAHFYTNYAKACCLRFP